MFRNVLIGIDGGPGGPDAVALAQRLAAPDAKVTLAHVYAGNLATAPSVLLWDEVEEQRAVELLAAERARLHVDGDVDIASISAGTAGEGLHRLAEQLDADLLVIGSSRRGVVGRIFVGDDTRASLNGAPCAVAIASRDFADTEGGFARIGVGYALSPEGDRALEAAREIARRDGSEIEVVHAVHAPMAFPRAPMMASSVQSDMLAHAQEVLASLHGVSASAVLGDPKQELSSLGQRVDLLVVGSRGYGPVGRMLFGSTSSYLQRHATCPILVVRRESPVPRDEVRATDAREPVRSGSHTGADAARHR